MVKDTTRIEYTLCAYARPVFLAITEPDENNDIQIVISCVAFRTMNIGERIAYIFKLLNKHIPDVMQDRLVIIQAYDPDQVEEVLDKVFFPEIEKDKE